MFRHCAILFRCAAVIANLGLPYPSADKVKSFIRSHHIELTEVQI
jgi:hypothetical protein